MDKKLHDFTLKPVPTKTSRGPKSQTIDFLRQFARAYMPVSKMPGLVLN